MYRMNRSYVVDKCNRFNTKALFSTIQGLLTTSHFLVKYGKTYVVKSGKKARLTAAAAVHFSVRLVELACSPMGKTTNNLRKNAEKCRRKNPANFTT